MKVVFDTNVLVSAFYSKRGASYQLLKAALSGNLPYAISPLLAFECENKVYEKIEEGLLRISRTHCQEVLDGFFAIAEIVWEPPRIGPVLSDLSDDKVLECAISADCTHIITFNKKHFPIKIMDRYGIEIATAGEFLEIWRRRS